MVAVGDLMLGDSPQVFGFGVASAIRRNGPDFPFAHVGDRLRAADLAIGNLEVVVAPGGDELPFEDRIYRGAPVSLDGVARAGFALVSVCTNHMMQHGDRALEACLQGLAERQIGAIGVVRPSAGLFNRQWVERRGRRFAVLGYNFRPIQYHAAPPAWPTPTQDAILADIAEVRREADVVVVTLHWGDEFIERPAPAQVRLARALIDGGADIILGHHPHIVQGVERWRGGVIAYSLGNFVYDQWQERLRRSMMLEIDVHAARQLDVRITPVMINREHQPVPLSGSPGDSELAYHQRLAELVSPDDDGTYADELAGAYQRFRREIMWHYGTQFWRFKPRDFVDNVRGIVARRV